MAGNAKNIIVGAAQVFISYGANNNRPNPTGSAVFPFSVNGNTNGTVQLGNVSTAKHLLTTASSYWRDFGFTSTGVDVSYEPGYSDVVVDQLLDAARLFQQSLKVTLKTELDEGTFENMNIVWGQQEAILNAGAAASATVNTQWTASSSSVTASAAVAGLNIAAGALGITPMERSMVFIGNAPGTWGSFTSYPTTSSTGSATVASVTSVATNASSVSGLSDVSSIRSRERVYYVRRIIQEQTTSHALKRDAATVFPVSFRALPEADPLRDYAAGSEYGFIIDRVYSTAQ